jgi:Na+/phosphate symporter
MKTIKKKLKKPFYHYLIKIERISLEVKKAGLTKDEEKEIWNLIEGTIHTRAIDAILEKLPNEKHEEFLEKFSQQPHDLKLLDYLRQEVKDIEAHLTKVFHSLEEEILSDITTK